MAFTPSSFRQDQVLRERLQCIKIYSQHDINDFIICCGYKGYIIKEFFANYFLHTSDVTFDMKANQMTVHNSMAEPSGKWNEIWQFIYPERLKTRRWLQSR